MCTAFREYKYFNLSCERPDLDDLFHHWLVTSAYFKSVSLTMSQKFRIVMDSAPGVFYPGDIVSGKVVLHSPVDEEVFNVAITFCASAS